MNDYMYRRFRRLGIVPRWTVVPTLRQQFVDQHCYQATQIARELLPMHQQGSGADNALSFHYDVICYALDHDWDEAEKGDTPSPAKPIAPLETNQVKVVVKCADILEAICFLAEEQAMGNFQYIGPVVMELKARFHDWWQLFEYQGKKPLSSDLIAMFTKAVTNPIHPAMEARSK